MRNSAAVDSNSFAYPGVSSGMNTYRKDRWKIGTLGSMEAFCVCLKSDIVPHADENGTVVPSDFAK